MKVTGPFVQELDIVKINEKGLDLIKIKFYNMFSLEYNDNFRFGTLED